MLEAPLTLAPKAPKGLGKRAKSLWKSYWASPVAAAIEISADGYLVERWIRLVDELETVYPEFQDERVVTGSMGQLTLNPLGKYISDLQGQIARLEAQLGMGPLNRMRLGVAVGESKLTADKLNERLDRRRRDDQDDAPARAELDAIEAEWSETG